MVEKLKELKERSHMTNQQISLKSGVPESTVARIFSGKTPNPTILTVVAMVRAMDGTAEDIFSESNESGPDGKIESGNKTVPQDKAYSADMLSARYFDEMIAAYRNEIRKKDKYIRILFVCFITMVLFIMVVLAVDLINPNIGFFRLGS